MRLLKHDVHVQHEYGEAEDAAAYRMRASLPLWARCRSYLPDDRSRSKLRQTPEIRCKERGRKQGSGREMGEEGERDGV